MTRYKVCPNQLNRLKRTEKLHRLKSQPTFSEVSVISVYFILPLSLLSALAVNNPPRFLFLSRARQWLISTQVLAFTRLNQSIVIVQGCRLYLCGNGNRNCSVSWNERFRWSTQQDMAGRSYVSYHGYTRHRGLCRMPSCKLVIRSTFIIT